MAYGRAKISLVGGLDRNFVLMLIVVLTAGAAMHFSGMFQPAFAEQQYHMATPDNTIHTQASGGNSYHRSMSESMSVSAMHGSGSNFPTSYQRIMTESMSVTSFQGKAPNSFVRPMSEQASMTSGIPVSPPPQASQPARMLPASYLANSNQRIEERQSPTLKMLVKKSDATKNTIGGTPYLATESFSSMDPGPPDHYSEMDELSGQESDPDDSSALLEYLDDYVRIQQSIENAALLNVSVSAIFLAGTLAVAVTKQPVILGGSILQKRFRAVCLLKNAAVSERIAPLTPNAPTTRVLLFVIVVFTVPPLTVSTAPSSAQHYDANLGKSIVEILQAKHLDYDRTTVLSDITKESRKQDNIWSREVSDGQYLRVTFEQNLTSSRDITIYARVVSGEPRIQVYEKDGQEIIAEFTHLASNENNKVYLTNLQGSQDTFDLRVVGGGVELDHIVDPWPIPTYIGAGATASGTGDISPALPSGVQANDIMLLFVETANQAVSISNHNGGTWTQVTNSPQGTGSGGGSSSTRLTVFWSRHDGSQGAPTVTGSTNHKIGVILAFRGVVTSGVPWDVTSGGVESSTDTSGSIPGATTTVTNALVVMAIATHRPDANRSTNFSAWANGDLANISELLDVTRNTGNGGGLGIATGEKATAGAYGATTVTLGQGATKGMMTIALKPPLPVAPTLSISQPDGIGDTVTRGNPYDITYTLFDPDDVTTAAFFYDTNNLGLDGTAISGACATAAEGTNITCQWDTTDVTPGSYYIYGIANDGMNPAVSAYSSGQITINIVINSRGVTEQAGITDSISASQVLSRSVTDQVVTADNIVKVLSFAGFMTEQMTVSDNTETLVTATFEVSITEQADLQDRIHRSRNGYSAGTVYRSDTGEFGLNSVKYRQWDPTASIWSYEVELPDTGSPIRDAKIAFSPVNEMRIVVSHSEDGTLNLFRCDAVCIDSASWTLVSADFADTGTPSSLAPYRLFDIAFEQQSGTLLIVYDRTASQAVDFYYRTYDGETLSSESGYNYFGNQLLADSETIPFFRLASKPGSDEIAMVLQDFTRQDAYAFIFDADTGNPSTANQVTLTSNMGTTSIDGEAIGIAYEQGSGNAVAFAANNADSMSYATWDGVAWSSVSTVDPNPSTSSHIKFMSVKPSPSPSTDGIMICQVDDQLDLTCAEMRNGLLGSFTVIDSDVDSMTTRPFDFVWLPGLDAGILVYGTESGEANWQGWFEGSWIPLTSATFAGTHPWIVGHEAPSTSELAGALFLAMNSDFDIGSLAFSLATPTILIPIGSATHTLDAETSVTEGMDIDWQFSGVRQPFRLPVDALAMTDLIRISVSKARIEFMTIADTLRLTLPKTLTESLAITDAVSIAMAKSIPEQLGVTENIAKVLPKDLSENLGLTETIARPFVGARSISETLTVADVIVKKDSRTLTEQLAISDSIEGTFTLSVSISEQMTTVDVITKTVSKAISEQARMTETMQRSVMQSRTIQEQLAIIDTAAIAAYKSMTEQLGVSDTVARLIEIDRLVSEQLGISDVMTKGITVEIIEQLAVGEAVDSLVSASRSLNEPLTLTESISASSEKELTDTMTLSDTLARAITVSQSASEQLALSDTTSSTISKSLTEQISLTETMTREIITSMSIFDELAITEAITVSMTKMTSDQIGMADSLEAASALSRTMDEQLGVTDDVVVSITKEMSEQWSVNDDIQRTLVLVRSLTEQMNINDTMTKQKSISVADQMSVTDNAGRIILVSRTMYEGLSLAETPSISATKPVSEQSTITDAVAVVSILARAKSDQLGMSEIITVSVTKTMSEELGMTDEIQRVAIINRNLIEELDMSEIVYKASSITIAEQMAMSDNVARSVVQMVTLTEQFELADAVSKAIEIALSEQMEITENVARTMELARMLSEQLSAADAMTKAFAITLSEQMNTVDAITRSVIVSRIATEAFEISDAITKATSFMLSENLAVTDTVGRAIEVLRSMDELIEASDTTSIAVSTSQTEQLAAIDTIESSIEVTRAISEQIGLTETITKAFSVAIDEQMAVTDEPTRLAVQSVSMTEQLAIADIASKTVAITLNEQVAIQDNLARVVILTRTADEVLVMQDAVAAAISITAAEQMALADNVTRTVITSRFVSDELALTEKMSISMTKAISEQMEMAESLASVSVLSRAIDDQMSVADDVSISVAKATSELLIVTDDMQRSISIARSLTEQFGIIDTTAKQTLISISEQIEIADTMARNVVQSVALTEQIVISEDMSPSSENPVSESFDMNDTVARSVVQSLSVVEQFVLSETVSVRTEKVIAEAMIMTDVVSVTSTSTHAISEEFSVSDMLSLSISRSLTEQMGMSDTPARSVTQSRSISESMVIEESAIKGAVVELTEEMTMRDAVRSDSSTSAIEGLSMSESIAIHNIKEMAEQFDLSEAIAAGIFATDLSDNVVVSDIISLVTSKHPLEQMVMTDDLAIAVAIKVVDHLTTSDSIVGSATEEIFASDQLGIEEFIVISVSKQLADGMTLSDTFMTTGSTTMAEMLNVTDTLAASIVNVRAISDGLVIAEDISGAPAMIVTITELMAVTDSFTDISMSFSLSLAQTLVLAQGFATDFSGVFDQVDSERIIIGDSLVLELETIGFASESMSMQDQVTVTIEGRGRGMAESMQASDWVRMLVTRPPPLPPSSVGTMPDILITETEHIEEFKGLIDPKKSVPISGTWNIASLDEEGLEDLLDQIGMPVYDVEKVANSADIDNLTMVLPTFWVSMGGEWENDAAFLTPMLSDIPKGAHVIVPINIAASMEGDENLSMLGNMTLNFTTDASATNFALLINVLDDNPEADVADDPPNELPAFFIEVTVIGDFPGARPNSPGFFEDPPELTFTLTEDWAVERNVERDEDGWPIIGLFLLDESNGTWLELTDDLSHMVAEDDTYSYTATLPHFSTYVVTAGTVPPEGPSEDGELEPSEGGSRGPVIVNPTEPTSPPDDSGIPIVGRIVIKEIADSLALNIVQQKPLHQRIITIHNVTVAVSLIDLQTSGLGTATATLEFEITNRNGADKQLTIRYWYSDQITGQTIYEDVQQVTVGASGSISRSFNVPFYSEGVFDLMIDVESDDGTLASTDIVVNVPWLAIYLYALMAVAAIIVALSSFYVLFAMRRRRRSDGGEY